MHVRLPLALTLIHEPHGLHLYDAGALRHWEASVLSQEAFASLLCFCDRWRDRKEVVEFLIEAANASPEVASATLDHLVEQGLLATDGDLHHAYAGDHTAAWHGYGWEDPFWYHFHTNSLPWMDYSTDPQGTADKDLMQRYLEAEAPPDKFKGYPEAETVPLARVTDVARRSLSAIFEDDVGQMRARGPLALWELSWLTRLAYGQTAVRKLPLTGAHIAKTSPSGGSRHPTEVYPVILGVDGVRPGVYHYNVRDHHLECLHTGHYHDFVRRHVIRHRGRPAFPAQVVYLLTTIFDRSMFRYRESRSYRVMHHDIGHLMQTTAYLASALDRSSYRGYSLSDSAVDVLLGIDGILESVMAFVAVG